MLHHALIEYGYHHLDKSGNIGANDIIAGSTVFNKITDQKLTCNIAKTNVRFPEVLLHGLDECGVNN